MLESVIAITLFAICAAGVVIRRRRRDRKQPPSLGIVLLLSRTKPLKASTLAELFGRVTETTFQVVAPQGGRSVTATDLPNGNAVLGSPPSFLVQAGDRVAADQDVLEVETNKATMNVTAPCPGRIQKFLVQLNESYPVGAVLGYLEVSKAEAARHGLSNSSSAGMAQQGAGEDTSKVAGEKSKGVEPTVRGLPVPAHASGVVAPLEKAGFVDGCDDVPTAQAFQHEGADLIAHSIHVPDCLREQALHARPGSAQGSAQDR